jgi:hypothetical protein
MNQEGDDLSNDVDQTSEVMDEQSLYKQIPEIGVISEQNPAVSNQSQVTQQVTMPMPLPMPLPIPNPNQQVVTPIINQSQLTNDPGIAPLPPTGLPDGWTMEQWEHYGWKYMESFKK